MWPFKKKRSRLEHSDIIDDAIGFAADRWRAFYTSVPVPSGSGLRERIALFARTVERSLHARHPGLTAASDEVMLLIIAKGVADSGTVSRVEIENALGIVLPP